LQLLLRLPVTTICTLLRLPVTTICTNAAAITTTT